jgi:hypothetical protein
MNTDDLLRQIEALLIQHEDHKQRAGKQLHHPNGQSQAAKKPA